ncbi:MAG: DUF6691 family protein [Hyphomicrobiales bacterium]
MRKLIAAAFVGGLFGFGIAISGMANPAKVLNFFDVFGHWDPSLAFVMGGALLTTAFGYRLVFGRQNKPAFNMSFLVPEHKAIDKRLILGSATFGIGWGIAGFCPGGAIPALGLGYNETFIFFGAMVIGIVAARSLSTVLQKQTEVRA